MKKYERLDFLSDNREMQRAYYIPENGCTLLNSEWNFKFFECDFEEEYVDKEWNKIPVPSCWELYGYENPNYANMAYPHPVNPPYIPTNNPMGIYERTFEVTDAEREKYIVFEGVSSCLELYINGEYVGFSQGSHLQAEFNMKMINSSILAWDRRKVIVICAGLQKWTGSVAMRIQNMCHTLCHRNTEIIQRQRFLT